MEWVGKNKELCDYIFPNPYEIIPPCGIPAPPSLRRSAAGKQDFIG